MSYKNLLFDFDGTLGDTCEGIVRTVQGTLARMGLPAAEATAVTKTIGLPLPDCFRIATQTPEERIQEATDIYREIFPSLALDHITLFPGVHETLGLLRQKGVIMAIASSRHHLSLDPLVQQLGIVDYIPLERVYGEDDTLRPKPAPDMALKILRELHLDASSTLVVGDTVYDLQMGAAAGCRTCGVTYGNQSRQQLHNVSPDHLIDDFASLVNLLDSD